MTNQHFVEERRGNESKGERMWGFL